MGVPVEPPGSIFEARLLQMEEYINTKTSILAPQYSLSVFIRHHRASGGKVYSGRVTLLQALSKENHTTAVYQYCVAGHIPEP